MKLKISHIILFSIILSGSLLFLYILVKAYVSSFTHDESFSYLHYIDQSFMQVISFSDWYTNNHILNSLLMKYSEKLFGNSELALRLPNLVLLLAYMLYSYRLFKDKGNVLSISLFLLLCTNVLLMDLFGLARGYGLSCGFMLIGLFHFIEYIKHIKRKDLYLFHFSALLASLSNFTLITVYVALLIVYNIVSYLNNKVVNEKKFHFIRTNKEHLIPLLIVAIVLYEPLRRVLTHSELDFGGKIGFFNDTVSHLIMNTFHNAPIAPSLMIILKILFTAVVIIPFFIIVINAIQKKREFFRQYIELIISNFLIITISIVIIMQHLVFGSDYPISRFSIYLFPVFIIYLGFAFYYFATSKYKKVFLTIIFLIALTSTADFYKEANLYFCAEWGYDAETKNMISVLEKDVKANNNQKNKIKLGINWIFEPTINYYRKKNKIDWLIEADRMGIKQTDDYLYIFEEELNKLKNSEYKTIMQFKDTRTYLIKNNTNAE